MSTLASSSWPSFPSYLGPHRITPSHIVHTSELSFDDVPIFDPIRDKRARDDHTEQADEMDLDIDSMMRWSSQPLWTHCGLRHTSRCARCSAVEVGIRTHAANVGFGAGAISFEGQRTSQSKSRARDIILGVHILVQRRRQQRQPRRLNKRQ